MCSQERFDLHIHSNASDGTIDPYDLAALVAKSQLRGFSLTDHDTLEGLENAEKGALEQGLLFCPGVEISCSYLGKNLHLLGYGFDREEPFLKTFFQEQKQKREIRNRALLEALAAKGIMIDYQRLVERAKGVVGRLHFAQELVAMEKAESTAQAFSFWIGEGSSCYVPYKGSDPDLAIRVIRGAGGRALLAHPHLMESSYFKKTVEKFPWDGLEVFYARFPKSRQIKWLDWVEKRGRLFSGGSDFHGEAKRQSFIGSSWIERSAFKKLLEGTHWASRIEI